MAVWPGTTVVSNEGEVVVDNAGHVVVAGTDFLPGPLKDGIEIQQGTNVVKRALQSGRVEIRRMGTGAPDTGRITILLDDDHVDLFKHFFQRDLNLGINWFRNDWLESQGYTDHMAKIMGEEPAHEMTDDNVHKFTMTILIKPADQCPDDVFWPTGKGVA